MKNGILNKKIWILLLALTLGSCQDFLQEEALTEVTADFVYNTEDGLKTAVVGLYDINRSIYDEGRHEWFATLMIPVKSDLAVSRAGVISLFAQLIWGIEPDGYQASLLRIFWRHHYRIVDRANAIIAAAEKLETLDPDVRDRIIGEAKFFRAHSYFTLYRLAETYLIAAEAYMRMNGSTDPMALQYINTIRQRAGLEDLTQVDQSAILDERARELAFEGQRWYTLKRMGILVSQIRQYAGDDGFQDGAREKMAIKYIHLPIPQSELDLLGTNYPQNEGY